MCVRERGEKEGEERGKRTIAERYLMVRQAGRERERDVCVCEDYTFPLSLVFP